MKGLNTQGDFDQYGIAGNPMNEVENCELGQYIGENNQGDFDQNTIKSIGGVEIDFARDFNESYDVKPKTLKGEYLMNGPLTQMGDAYELGIMPEFSMGNADYGIMPQMAGPYQQVGGPYNQVGSMNQMGEIVPKGLGGMIDDVKLHMTKQSVLPVAGVQNWMMYAGLAAAAFFVVPKVTGKKIGVLGF